MNIQRNLHVSRSGPNPLFSKIVQGAVAGWVATAPMTLFMELAWRLLPAREKYPLPPRIITNKLRRRWASKRPFRQSGETTLTLFLHFLFGAMAGVVYGVFENEINTKSHIKGIGAGLILWSGSYLGWIPATHMLPSAIKQPWRRTLLMIVAHVVWGGALGLIIQRLNSGRKYIKL